MPEMRAYKRIQTVDILCLPSDLRELADKMEKQIKRQKLGDDTLVEYVYGKKVLVGIRIDQDRL